MSDAQVQRLTRFANQIAKNFIAIGHDKAVAATADHIEKFWDPRMKAAMFAAPQGGLDPVAKAAVAMLARGVEPEPQTRATQFADGGEVGPSDAG